LDKLDNLLREYGNAFKTRQSAYSKRLEKLKQDIVSLQNDIKKVTEISNNIKSSIEDKITQIEEETGKEFEEIIEKTKKEIEEKLNKNNESRKKEEKDRKNEGHNVNNNSILHRELWTGGLFDFLKKDKSKDTDLGKLSKEGKLTFKNKNEAEKVINEINNLFIKILGNSSKVLKKNINKHIKKLSNNINEDIKKELGDLVTKIAHKLSDEADGLNIVLPTLNINFNSDLQNTLQKSIKKDKEIYKVKGDGLLNNILHWFNSEWGTKTICRDVTTIEKNDVINNIKSGLDKLRKLEVDNLTKEIEKNIKKPIDSKLQNLTKEIDGYIYEQKDILSVKEKEDKKIIETMIENNKKFNKTVLKLDKRAKEAKKQLEYVCE
jgi:hypothetical protein